jgi:hypothetical protein
MKRSPQRARDSVHIANGEVHMNRNGCADVFQHQVALDRLGFEGGLIDKNSHVFSGAKLGQRLR